MRTRAHRHMYLDVLRGCYLFHGLKARFLDELLSMARMEIFMPGVSRRMRMDGGVVVPCGAVPWCCAGSLHGGKGCAPWFMASASGAVLSSHGCARWATQPLLAERAAHP